VKEGNVGIDGTYFSFSCQYSFLVWTRPVLIHLANRLRVGDRYILLRARGPRHLLFHCILGDCERPAARRATVCRIFISRAHFLVIVFLSLRFSLLVP
jgi:hypothetical protein